MKMEIGKRGRTVTRLALVSLLVAGGAGQAGASVIKSTFEIAGNEEGWTTQAGNDINQVSTGGNPGGYLQFVDHVGGQSQRAFAPAAFLGNLGSFNWGTLSFDFKRMSGTYTSGGTLAGTVTIHTGSGDFALDMITSVPPSTAWTSYSTQLSAADWGVTQSVWEAGLASVTGIDVIVETNAGDDTNGMDNFQIAHPIPEPSSMILFATGSLLLTRYRRSRLGV